MSWLQPIDKQLLFTRNDKEDPRLGECVQTLQVPEQQISESINFDFAIIGYPDDEGIALNGGRQGAKDAPKEVRKVLYKMTPHLHAIRMPQILDLGDLANNEKLLIERHEKGREIIRQLAASGKRWISIGGGHDYGYSDSCGFLDVFKDRAIVLNFDAHLDVRPTDNGLNSGTPFYRMLSEYSGLVDFAEVGIQSQCNSKAHQSWAKSKNAAIFNLEQIAEQGLKNSLQPFLQGKAHKRIFLSVDIDAFTSSEAPGCSQSWTTGLRAQEFLSFLSWLIENYDVRGLGLYEVSPTLDQDHRTSKLAALRAHKFIFANLNRKLQ